MVDTYYVEKYAKEQKIIDKIAGNCWWMRQYILGNIKANRERSKNENRRVRY